MLGDFVRRLVNLLHEHRCYASEKLRELSLNQGNCASALIQGVHYYGDCRDSTGLLHQRVGPYGVIKFCLISVTATFSMA